MERSYQRPPVYEALCEIYFQGSQLTDEARKAFSERILGRYPLTTVHVDVELTPGETRPIVLKKNPRWQYRLADKSRIVQIADNLLVVNQLRPYPCFETWRDVTLEMLTHYQELAKPEQIERIGVRYLNRVEIPKATLEMEDYFTIYLNVPASLGAVHGPFLIRTELAAKHPDDHQLLFTFSTSSPEQPGAQAFLLDLYDICTVEPGASLDRIRMLLDDAHENIEQVFENVITAKTRMDFEEKADAHTTHSP